MIDPYLYCTCRSDRAAVDTYFPSNFGSFVTYATQRNNIQQQKEKKRYQKSRRIRDRSVVVVAVSVFLEWEFWQAFPTMFRSVW